MICDFQRSTSLLIGHNQHLEINKRELLNQFLKSDISLSLCQIRNLNTEPQFFNSDFELHTPQQEFDDKES